MTTNRLPTGTVTFLFSDIEDSTGVLQRLGADYRSALERHAQIIRGCLQANGGHEVSTEGDSFFAAFESAPPAIAAASEIQQRLDREDWPEGGIIRVRIGLHAGSAEIGHDNYIGIDVHRGARIGGAGHGGQVVVSDAVRALAPNSDYVDLGRHRLKGLEEALHLYQLNIPGLEQAFPPLRSSDARPNNLPSLENRIVGRESDVSDVIRILEDNRLVTIVGPGGIGKTRLAIEIAGEVLSEFQDGVYLIELAPVADPDLVMPNIAAVLGVDDVSARTLSTNLSDQQILLVLDNLEQVVAAAPDIKGLLDQAPTTKILATSQVPLRLGGERTYRLSPLPWEGVDSPAVEIFASRAKEIDPFFDINEHRDAVVRLAEALDGVPLALELAASRANVLTPEEIVSRLSANVDLLKASGGDTPERHRSIAAAIEWSFDMLTESRQRLLECFAVFRGGASLSALGAVAGFDPLDDLGELVERSLVSTASGRAGKRFEVLAPVRLYVTSRLNDLGQLAERHSEFFHQLALRAEKPLETDKRARWAAVLSDDHGNLQAALEHLQQTGDAERGLDMLGHTWRYYQVVGRFRELELWLNRFFDLPGADEANLARARGLMARAAVHYWRSDPRAANDYQEAVDIARRVGEDSVLAYALSGLGASITATTGQRGSLERVAPILDEARQIFEKLGDMGGLAVVEAARAFTSSWAEGQLMPHRPELEKVAELYEAAGQRINTAHTILGIAAGEVMEGHPEEALKQALTSLSISEEFGDRFAMIWALEWIATAKADLGDSRTAALLAGAAGAGREKAGGGWTPATYGLDDAATRVRKALGDEADKLLAQGEAMSFQEAVELAKT